MSVGRSAGAAEGPAVGRPSRLVRRLMVLVAVAAAWYGVALLLRLSGDPLAEAKLPFIHDIAARGWSAGPTVLEAAWMTGSRAVLGFFVGLLVGGTFATVMLQARWLERAFMPYVLASQMIPLIALIPILRAILQDADLVRLYVTSFVTFFIVTIAVLRGLKNAPGNAVELMDSLNAGRWTTLRYLRFPAALPYIFSGLRVAAPLSLVGAILVDFLGARNGLGYLMVASLSIGSSQATLLWASLLVTLFLGLLFTRSVGWAERRVSFWQPAFRSTAE